MSRLPDHCCCCGLRPGACVIGGFVLVVCISFMVILGGRSTELNEKQKEDDVRDAYYLVIYLYGLNATLSAIEVLFTIGLFWGIHKNKEKWVRRWLFVTIGWWTEHSIFSMAILMSSSRHVDLLCGAFLGPFLFFLGYRCMKTVAGLREEMLRPKSDVEDQRPLSLTGDGPAGDNADASAGADDNVQL